MCTLPAWHWPLASIAGHAPGTDCAATGEHADCQRLAAAYSWPWFLLLALAPTTKCVSATSPCHYIGICSCPMQLSVYIPLVPTITTVCPGPWIWRCCWGPNSHCSFSGLLQHSSGTTQLLMPWAPAIWAQEKSCSPTPIAATYTHLVPCISRPGVTACCSVPFKHCRCGSLHLPKSVHSVQKRWLLLQMQRHLHKAAGIMKNQGTGLHQRNTVNFQ